MIAIGKEIEAQMIASANTILTMMAVGDYAAEALDQALDDLQEMLTEAKFESLIKGSPAEILMISAGYTKVFVYIFISQFTLESFICQCLLRLYAQPCSRV